MKIKYQSPITDENLEDVSLEIEKGIEKIRQATAIDWVLSPLNAIINVLTIPLIAILVIMSTQFRDVLDPLANNGLTGVFVKLADAMDFAMLGSFIHPAIVMLIVAIALPLIISWPIYFMMSKFTARSVRSPLEGENNKAIKANILCDQVDNLKTARAETTKKLFPYVAFGICVLMYLAYALYATKNMQDVFESTTAFAFVVVIAGMAYAMATYGIIFLSKNLVIRFCGIYPVYYVKQLKIDARNYLITVHMPSIIKTALTEDSFYMNYQPIYWTDREGFYSAEALCRLNNPVYGMIPPPIFVDVAEKTGQISQLTDAIVRKVCAFVRNPRFDELSINYVNINLSVIDVVRRDRLNYLIGIVDTYGIPHHKIGFEITESVAESSTESFWDNVNYLADQGFVVSMDDFGTGYSSLSRVISDAFTVIKLDRSLIADKNDKEKRTLLVDIVNMIKHLNKKIVMEGVETKEQLDLIKELGIEHIQGYFYSKPLDENRFIDFIKSNNITDFSYSIPNSSYGVVNDDIFFRR